MIAYRKKAASAPQPSDPAIAAVVSEILLDVERNGERAVRKYSERFDSWSPQRFTLSRADIARQVAKVPAELRAHIDFARDQIRGFATAQRGTMLDVELETVPGVTLGHRHVAVGSVGAYSPGGRYPLIASSLMTTVVPKAAGVDHVIACAPPLGADGIAPAMLYAMDVGGADQVLSVGGAQAMAALAFGIEDHDGTDMLIGAGNAYVAEAKRQLFGTVGIDLMAGPTEVLIIADQSADAGLLASDLAGQLEHGPTSVGWLITNSTELADEVAELLDQRLAALPTGGVASQAWEHFGEIVVCDSDDEMVEVADQLAAEHVEVHTEDPTWYLDRLRNYGSLFLGDEATVAYGDKGIGTNHVLPTARAARYTGGLWVGKFLKTLTYQRVTPEGSSVIAPTIVAISEAEHLPGHAQAAQDRLDRLASAAAGQRLS